jgi:predicted RNA-binding protein with PIN domain
VRALVVDGYNVIMSAPRYRGLADNDIEAARAALVGDVAAMAVGEYVAVVVFDGAGNPESDGTPHHLPGAAVIFSPAGVDADTVIEAIVHKHRERGDQVVVVTSDAQTQWAVMGPGVTRASSAEFVVSLDTDSTDWRAHNPSGSRKGTLDMRIDPDVREALSRWARGRA